MCTSVTRLLISSRYVIRDTHGSEIWTVKIKTLNLVAVADIHTEVTWLYAPCLISHIANLFLYLYVACLYALGPIK